MESLAAPLGSREAPSIQSTCVSTQEPSSQTDERAADEAMNQELEELAQQITRASHSIGQELHAIDPKPGGHLDPLSPSFNGRAWVKTLIRLSESDPNAAALRTLGVAFNDLNVFGWHSGAERQMTVASRVEKLCESAAEMVTGNRHRRRIDILHDFEGVVGEGEMLLVLGPPGSGCSTLLKTLAGETAGLQVASDSYINFSGWPSLHIHTLARRLQLTTGHSRH